jgi:phosphoribosyl 1,2-cyclic phosphodiesterase
VLREFSSWTPLIREAGSKSLGGGGYFVTAGDFGLAIDPGHGFIENFFRAGHSLHDIDAIVVTHLHADHIHDLDSLANLFRIQRLNAPTWSRGRRALLLNAGALVKSSTWLFNREILDLFDLHVMNAGDAALRLSPDLMLAPFRAKHDELIDDRYCLGLALRYQDRVVVITGDTGWSEQVLEGIAAALEALDAVGRVSLLVSHLGSIKAKEFRLLEGQPLSECLYANHLGALGVCAVAEALAPERCIISEIGEELAVVLRGLEGAFRSVLGAGVAFARPLERIHL